MAEVNIGNIDAAVLDRLKARASAHQRSVEEEIRVIVEEATSQPERRLTIREFIQRTEGIRQRKAR